jgi:glyoxylase-like metal-dependent hydrolase (beta-lactamase superfamily II)
MDRYRELGGYEGDIISAPLTTFVIRTVGRTILVDTGIGPSLGRLGAMGMTGTAGLLPDSLRAIGLDPEAVDTVVLTHLHSDHIGWNVTEQPTGGFKPTFRLARYVVNEAELAVAETVAGKREAELQIRRLVASGHLRPVSAMHEIAPGVRMLPTPGHTPGHVSILIKDGQSGGVITGDAVHHPGELEQPDVVIPFDSDAVVATASRRMLVERIEAEGLTVMGGHFPGSQAGRIIRVESKRRWHWLGG